MILRIIVYVKGVTILIAYINLPQIVAVVTVLAHQLFFM